MFIINDFMQCFRLLGPILLIFLVGWMGLVGWVGWLVSGWWVGGWVDGGEHGKKALADLFQTQVSLTPSVSIRDMTNLITV